MAAARRPRRPGKGFVRRCYCDFEPALVDGLAARRFGDRIPTLDLIAGARDPLAKEAAALVGLLDLPEADLEEVATEIARRRHLVACRAKVLARLARIGLTPGQAG